MKKLSIGISDFKELISEDYYYVDKTLLIKELIDASGKVVLLTRPRRFGKTLNLSMLKYFFDTTETSNRHLFEDKAIWKEYKYQKFQGKYPVILLTFKGVKEHNWQDCYEKLVDIIANEFNKHNYLLNNLSTYYKDKYQSILEKKANKAVMENSILFLTELLQKHYNNNVIVLLDEYDNPIHAAYHNGYYSEIITFMHSLLEYTFQDNIYLHRGFITGALRVAQDKESIFTGFDEDMLLDFFPVTIKRMWV